MVSEASLEEEVFDIGDKVKITIERDDDEETLVITLGSKNKEA